MAGTDGYTMGLVSVTPKPVGASVTVLEAVGKTVVSAFMLIFGTVGNSLILSVYRRKLQKTSTHILIMGLAGVDLGVCLMRIRNLAKFAYVLSGKPIPDIVEYPFVLLDVILLGCSSLLMGIIALDRYDSVCRPHRRIFNKLRAKLAILASLVFMLALALPNFMTKNNPTVNIQRYTLVLQVIDYVIPLLMVIVCYGRVYIAIRRQARVGWVGSGRVGRKVRNLSAISPNIHFRVDEVDRHEMKVTSFCNELQLNDGASTSANQQTTRESQGPAREVSRKKATKSTNRLTFSVKSHDQKWADKPIAPKRIRWREPPSSILPPMRASGQKKVTRMLFITSVVFLLAWLPYWVYVAIELFRQDGGKLDDGVLPALAVVSMFIPLNSTVNPIIYGLANRGFRQDCKNLFKKLRLC
ncbi:5-hydroxytryptamine receptor 1A-like [Patiria miniata]|uniref:G-protein coupled receptors family 1 profile domain-containing protein n=1 Tax=Patiria miniata TaxID=46514 RepID=A0A914ABA2_PATMI|nr:5-hydroxytryptamine receptor 1A-like [Patiria miniata]